MPAAMMSISRTAKNTFSPTADPAPDLEPVETVVVAKVIERLHALPARPCGKEICWAIRKISDRGVPAELLAILSDYALHDPDPGEEEWQQSANAKPLWSGDPHFHGMNSVRGASAEAAAALLFDDQSRYDALSAAVNSLVHDSSVAVRSCAVAILVALLNFDRASAVRLFLELSDGAEPLLGTRYVDQFLHHAAYDFYPQLRPLMLRMLTLEDEHAQAIAARQITVASFRDLLAAQDLDVVFAGTVASRKACAGVYAHNLAQDRIADVCRKHLPRFFRTRIKT